MEVLEVASIDVFSAGQVVVPARKRQDILCIVWEGTCIERVVDDEDEDYSRPAVWHAGDWAGPVALQPSSTDHELVMYDTQDRDIVAFSSVGVKIISLPVPDVEKILMRGSKQYRQYTDGLCQNDEAEGSEGKRPTNSGNHQTPCRVLEVLKMNSLLGSLHARQIRALESLAEGPRYFAPGMTLWRAGKPCDEAFLIASGTVSYQPPQGRAKSMNHARRSNRQASMRTLMDTEDGYTVEVFKMIQDLPAESEFAKLEVYMALRAEKIDEDPDFRSSRRSHSKKMDQKHNDRNVNKLFARLYASRKTINGLILSRGCFLSDTSSLVSGHLVQVTRESAATQHLHS